MSRTPNARGLIGAIKAGQAHLGWDDATYRAALERLTGKTSATKCTLDELQIVREYMHEQGYPRKTAKKVGRRPRVAATRETTLRKIEALLTEAKRPWMYAMSMSDRMFKQCIIEWLDDEQLTKLMQALIIDAKRHGRGGG
ncbi:regulatory protein GemA [Serratia fonticola]|uniref:gp16 family protein n=1 Tax=Serratia fonticola TaxID=47917 RepID=UPI003AAD41EF